MYEESGIALIALGSMVKTAESVREALKKAGYSCTLVNARFAKPFDEELLLNLSKNHTLFVTDNAFFAHMLPARFKLRLNQADHLSALV